MKGAYVKQKLVSKGYCIEEIAKLIDIKHDEFLKILESEHVSADILNSISKALGENIFVLNENITPTNVIEGNNNMLGDNNNTNNNMTTIKLVTLIEKKDEQIDKVLNLLSKKDEQIDRLLGILEKK